MRLTGLASEGKIATSSGYSYLDEAMVFRVEHMTFRRLSYVLLFREWG